MYVSKESIERIALEVAESAFAIMIKGRNYVNGDVVTLDEEEYDRNIAIVDKIREVVKFEFESQKSRLK